MGQAGASAQAIQFHYDVGDEFYRLWLDPQMVYSCALWSDEPDDDLESAQRRKIEWHLSQAGASGCNALLDVGCGWGALLRHAVSRYGVRRGVGLTLSRSQAEHVAAIGPPNVQAQLQAWQDHHPERPYDAIVSIGAFEHFADLKQDESSKLAGYRSFFRFCHRSLVKGGRLSLQTITYGTSNRRSFSPFFSEHVFPESDLPHLAEIVQAVDGLFEITILRNDREDYARTLRAWLQRLHSNRRETECLVGRAKVSIYEKYMKLMWLGFHSGSMNLARIGLRRIDGESVGDDHAWT
jgi:cyclopropane-fatty-acyl-phospholipid synthase